MPTQIEPGKLLASRFRVDEALHGEVDGGFLGTDEHTGQRIVVFALAATDAAGLRAGTAVSHQHLAKVIDITDLGEGSAAVIAEHVAGTRLDELLARIGKKQPVDAVRSALRIAEALTHLLAAGAVHGGVQPAAVVVDPQGRNAPVLAFAAPRTGPYRSPERGALPPSEADDAWATAGLLFVMLTGAPPPATGVASEQEIADAGVEDPDLRAALLHALSRDRASRSSDLKPFKRELARWFAEHAGEEVASSRPSTHPPPLPQGGVPSSSGDRVPAVATSQRTISTSQRRPTAMLAGLAIVLGLAAAWGVSTLRGKPEVVVQRPPPSAPSGRPEIALSEQPVTGETDALADEQMQSCVGGFLPKNTFGKRLAMDWVCTVSDPRGGGTRIRSAIVAGAPVYPRPTQTMKLFSQMGPYDMAVFALVRAACCMDAPPLKLPEAKDCPDMAKALTELGRAVTIAAGQGKDDALAQFTEAMQCEMRGGRGAMFNLKELPRPNQKDAFLALVELTQQP